MDMLTEDSTVADSTTDASVAKKRETSSDDVPPVTPFPHHDPDAEWTTPTPKPTEPPSTTKNPNPSPEATTVDPAASFPDHPAYNPIPIYTPSATPECMDLRSDTPDKKLAKLNCELEAAKKSMTELIQEFNKRLMTISKINIDLKNRMDRVESAIRTKSFSYLPCR
uniref:Uncharacterized protein n=2 Tax=Cacopsylla melanoneura TaxID=428564 RepID=A0A8D8TB64_9HEMI